MKAKGGIKHLSEQIKEEFKRHMPGQRKTQRNNLSELVATMLIEKSANTMDLAAALPRETERIDMRYQWISRTLGNDLIDPVSIMKAFAKPILESLVARRQIIVLLIDQTTAGNGDEILMISLRLGNRAIPLFWMVEKTKGNIGFEHQSQLLDSIQSILPPQAHVALMGDRFYGTGNLVDYCNRKEWDYRLRIKGNTRIQILNENVAADEIIHRKNSFVEHVFLASNGAQTNIGVIHDPGHEEPWIVLMNGKPDYYKTLDYGMRWSIESMFSDFKSRGFGLEETQMRYSSRLSRLILIMALAIYFAVNTGLWDEAHNALPLEKKRT